MKKLFVSQSLTLTCLVALFVCSVGFISAESSIDIVPKLVKMETTKTATLANCQGRLRITTQNIPAGATWGVTIFQGGVAVAQFTTSGTFPFTLDDDVDTSICVDASDIDVPHGITVTYDVVNSASGSFTYPAQTCDSFTPDCC